MIVQVGPYPEPYGGVSVYIKRMKEYLDSRNIANQVWDISLPKKDHPDIIPADIKRIPLRILWRRDIRLIHYHLYSHGSRVYIGYWNDLVFRRLKKVLTIHGDSGNMFGIQDRALRRALNSFDAIICVKSGDKQYLAAQGVSTEIREIPAFITTRVLGGNPKVPPAVESFIIRHSFIITANASALRFHHNTDLYGLDMCIELMGHLKQAHPGQRIGLVFCLSEVRDGGYFNAMQQKIRQCAIGDDFLLVTQTLEFYPVLQKSQLFIRPTNTDGCSVSLAEAIYFQIPVIASDASPRPEGTILFRSRDNDDLNRKTDDLIAHYHYYRERAMNLQLHDNAAGIVDLYLDLLGNLHKSCPTKVGNVSPDLPDTQLRL